MRIEVKQFRTDRGPMYTATGRYVQPQGGWYRLRVRSAFAKLWSFLRAITRGRVSRRIQLARLYACMGCDRSREGKDGGLYCIECKCGMWPMARLQGRGGKLQWKGSKCPHPKGSRWPV